MTEIRPLHESSPNPKTRALLRAGLDERPSARAAESVAAALGISLGLSTTTAGAMVTGSGALTAGSAGAGLAGGSSTLGALAIAKWFAAGALSGTLVASGSALVQHVSPNLPGAEPPALDPRRASAALVAPVVVRSEPNARPEASSTAKAAAPAASGTAPPVHAIEATRLSPPPKPSTSGAQSGVPASEPSVELERAGRLTLELERIDRARAAVAAGAPERALHELSQYARVRATGTLDREAWVLRIDALLMLGRREEARELARGYLERFPKDAHATRLRELEEGR